MIPQTLEAGPVRRELAAAIRAVNARHAEIGAPEIPGLTEAWAQLDRNLREAALSGDDVDYRRAVDAYRDRAFMEIEEVTR